MVSNKGFTTIEIAIVIMISGIMMTAFLNAYVVYNYQKDYNTTLEHMDQLESSLNQFLQEYGRYPCPADPTLPPNHADYGRETRCGNYELAALGGACDAGQRPLLQTSGAESNVICSRNSSRDIDGDGNLEYVLTGILPFRTLSEEVTNFTVADDYREYMALDGYDMRFTYAVTETMADRGRDFNNGTGVTPLMGAIKVVDENGVDLTIPASSAHYVLLSHGANKRGAYNESGQQTQDCDFSSWGGPVPPAGVDDPFDVSYSGSGLSLEIENCDHFIDPNPDNVDVAFRKAIRSNSEGDPNFFDDIVRFRASYSTNLWQAARNTAGFTGQRFLYNTNIGNVGVGNGFNNPDSKLHVLGDVVIVDDNTGSGSEPLIMAEDGYCDDDQRPGANDLTICMQPSQIAGAGSTCPDGEIAIGIDRGNVMCSPLFIGTVTPNFDCGVDTGDADGDGNVTEPLFATGIEVLWTAGGDTVLSPLGCAPL